MNKKLLSLLLAILMILSSFAACTDATLPEAPPLPDSAGDQTGDQTENQTPPESEVPSEIEYAITAETISQYAVVYPKERKAYAEAFCQTLNEKFGTSVTPVLDSESLAEKEIVIGEAKREAIDSLLEYRHVTDGIIACESQRIYIIASHKLGLEKAIALFWESCYEEESNTIRIKEKELKIDSEFSLSKNQRINGVLLNKYQIVYPANADAITKHTANALCDYFKANADINVAVKADSEKATDYEILIGATNRPESIRARALNFQPNQYTMYAQGNKIVCHGNGYYVGSAVHEFISEFFPDTGNCASINATNFPTECVAKSFVFPKATSAIMMIGDGMGLNHIKMALAAGALDHFYALDLPYQAWCRTYSASSSVTDSAASATALATGYKTVNGYIGKDASGKDVENISELAAKNGAKVAVVTTDTLSGATPAGFNAHNISRSNADDILRQFTQKQQSGELLYVNGSVGSSLTLETRTALKKISKNNSSFFIMVEEAYTDKGSHSNDANTSNSAVGRFNDSIAYAIAFVMLHPDTALIVTADHETGGIRQNADGTFSYTTTSHTATDVPYFALGGENVKEFVMNTDTKLNNVWNAMFLATIYGVDDFGDPALRYNK